jgi:RNA polymerase sigma factor (sigma-70 family)
MQERNDIELLQQYAREGSEEAFAAVVSRYVNLVYSAALRQTSDSHQAQEITQVVFIILARKAGRLSRKIILSGWLYQTARLAAANFRRGEIRRARREQEAHMRSTLNQPEPDAWPHISPMLDAAMGDLTEKDRHAIVLRFFQRKSLFEVGTALGSSEAAAKMRVNRALEKLRDFFAKRGVTLSAGVIAAAVSANSVQAAPAGLAASVSALAAKGTSVAASIAAVVKATLNTMNWIQLRLPLGTGAAIVLVAGLIAVALVNSNPNSNSAAAVVDVPAVPQVRALNAGPENRAPMIRNVAPDPQATEDDLTPTNLIAKVARAYAALTSYRDTGSTVHRYGDEEWTDTFTMRLARTNYYRIEHITAAHPFSQTYRYWSDGETNFSESTVTSLRLTLERTFSNFSCGGSTVPAVFFKEVWGNELMNLEITYGSNLCLVRLPDEKIGGVDCYVLSRTNSVDDLTMWVGKEDFLIRRGRKFSSPEQLTASSKMALEHVKNAPAVNQQYMESLKQEAKYEITAIETHENIVINEPFAKEDFIPPPLEGAATDP